MNNKIVKGDGGSVGLTECLVPDVEIPRVTNKFDSWNLTIMNKIKVT